MMFLAKITVYSEPENFSGIFLQNHYNGGGSFSITECEK